jgi:magnesium-transporting ATPase (P-type)
MVIMKKMGFRTGAILQKSFEIYNLNFSFILSLSIFIGLAVFMEWVAALHKDNLALKNLFMFTNFLSNVLTFLITLAIFTGIIFRIQRKKISAIGSFWKGFDYIGRFLATRIMTVYAVLAGFVLLIIPGIYLFFLFFLSGAAAINEKEDIGPIKTSYMLMNGYFWKVFPVFVVVVLLNIPSLTLSILYLTGKISIFGGVLAAVFSAFIGPAIMIIEIVVYFELKRIRKKEYSSAVKKGKLKSFGTDSGCATIIVISIAASLIVMLIIALIQKLS